MWDERSKFKIWGIGMFGNLGCDYIIDLCKGFSLLNDVIRENIELEVRRTLE